jgi:hypothetical protein
MTQDGWAEARSAWVVPDGERPALAAGTAVAPALAAAATARTAGAAAARVEADGKDDGFA